MRIILRIQFGIMAIWFPLWVNEEFPDFRSSGVGLIMGILQAGTGIGVSIAGEYNRFIGHKNSFVWGCAFFITLHCAFIATFYCTDGDTFFVVGTLTRFFSGLGNGFIVTSSVAIPSATLPKLKVNWIGLLQLSDFLGLTLGMIYVAIFISFVDFEIVMWVCAGQMAILLPFVAMKMPSAFNNIEDNQFLENAKAEISDSNIGSKVSYIHFL